MAAALDHTSSKGPSSTLFSTTQLHVQQCELQLSLTDPSSSLQHLPPSQRLMGLDFLW